MADDEPAEETRPVIEALQGIKNIPDDVTRARVISEVLRTVEELEPEWRADRRKTVLKLRADKTTYRAIAALIKVSLGTVQSIERGHAGAWRTKARKKPEAKGEGD
ncbi:hypothetical protein [Streptomyces collinus]